MITLKDLNLLINHLHQANHIFDTEAILEERKHQDVKHNLSLEKRANHAPRSVILHGKAEQVASIEKRLLQECDKAIVRLEENTIYSARELIAESMYPWIYRKEPPIQYMEDLLTDETFVPFASGLEEKKERLMTSGLHILLLSNELIEEIQNYFLNKKTNEKKDITVSVYDIINEGQSIENAFEEKKEYKTKLINFRLHVLGLIDKK